MKMQILGVVALGAITVLANPLGFTAYEREVKVTYPTTDAAKSAEMKICALPHGAKMAFTTRWDDCQPNDLAKRDMINSVGCKATFFLNYGPDFIAKEGRELLKGGNSLGNHSMHHPLHLLKKSYNTMFAEVILNRIAVESGSDSPVVSFVMPYNWESDRPEAASDFVRILCDCGNYVSSDWPIDNCAVGPDTWLVGWEYDSNDKQPNEWVFNDRIKKNADRAMKGDYPKVTFGMHAWCDAKGNALQKKFLSKYVNNPDWFYGNDNEYGAHRYAGFHGKAVRKSVDGKTATFALTMFDPAQTGSDIPVSVTLSGSPESVVVDGQTIAPDRGTYAIPHSLGPLVKADAAKDDGTFAKFAGLKLTLVPDEFAGTLAVKLENGFAALEDVNFTVMPSVGWKNRRIVRAKGALAKGKDLNETFDLGGRFDDPRRWEGASLYVVSVDFHRNGKACRAWATATVTNPFVPALGHHARAKTVAKDAVVKSGADKSVSLEGTWKVSVPQCSDKPWGESKIEEVTKWVDRPVPQNWNKAFLYQAYNKAKPYVMEWYTRDFDVAADAQGKRTYLSFEGVAWNTIIYVNGKEVGRHLADYAPFEVEITSAVHTGSNKLAVFCRWDLAKYGNPAIAITHPSGNQWWYQNIHGGIWAPLSLVTREPVAVTRLLANPRFAERSVEFDYVIDNDSGKALKTSATLDVVSAMAAAEGKRYGGEQVKLELKPGVNQGTIKVQLAKDVPIWDVGKPELLWGVLKIDGGATEAVRFGMREFKVKDGRFWMNGSCMFIFGQGAASQEFVPVGKTSEAVKAEAETQILKFLDAGCNFVRTVHEPILKEYLDVADECGLPIFHEWAWGFSSNLDMTTFRPACLQGVEEYIYGSYNHPSVIAWSMDNEVNVWQKEEVWKLADEIVDFAHKLDRQGRPVSTGSGSGGGFSGNVPVKTDILDFHDYVGCSSPWSEILDNVDGLYARNEKKYGAEAVKKMPMIGMEMLGFSWLDGHDPDWKPGDRQIYQKFLDRHVDWGGGKGAGLLGAMPMEIVVKKQNEFYDLACNRYGRRLFEEMRLNPKAHGFAPWGAIPTESTVWTQPLFPALRNAAKLNPRNLFAGETTEWTAYVHNAGRAIAKDLELEVSLNGTVLAKVKMGDVETDVAAAKPVKLTWPKNVRGEGLPLGLRVLQNGKTVGLNSYEVFFASRAEETAAIKAARPVAVLDCGCAANVTRTVKLFKDFGVDAAVVKSAGEAKDGSLLVVPPDYDGAQKFFGAKQDVSEFVSLRRGTLLILEQHGLDSALPASQQLFKGKANFTDLVLPSHPAFAGLTWRQFDTWNNPDHGHVAIRYLSPFRWENSLAVKGPQLMTGNEFGSVLFEGTAGEGRYIISLFEAIKCAPEDAAAAKYLRNLLAYAVGKDYCKDVKPVSGGKPLFAGKPEDVVTIDLRKFANAGFADRTPADDKQGGWLDQGDNDFRNVAAGKRQLRGVPFDVIEPEKNGDKSVIRVAGKARPYFPEAVKGIPLGGKYDMLFFLHTAGFAGNSDNCGAYRMHYADGSTEDFKIEAGSNVADWWNARDCPKAPIGLLVRSGKGANVAAYIASWTNPHPDKQLVSFDFLSAPALRAGQNAWAVTSDPVPVLIAVSALKAGAMPKGGGAAEEFDLSGKEWKRQSPYVNSYPNNKVKDIVENGRHGMEIPFPAWTSGKDKDPFVMLWHNCPKGRKFTELVFQAKADDNCSLKFVFVQRGWKFQLGRYAKISGGGDWQEVRVNLTGKNWEGKEIDWSDLMEELFIYYTDSDKKGVSYPEARISIKDLRMIGPAPAAAVGGGEFDLSGKEWNRQSGFVTGYPNQKVKDIVENGRHGMEIPFPAWTDGKDKCPFVMLWHKLPKGRKFKELVFQAKCEDNATVQFVIPQRGWAFQLGRYAKISGGGDWQEVRVNLTGKNWQGKEINWSDLIEEMFIYYQEQNAKGKSYPAATISIKDIRWIDAD